MKTCLSFFVDANKMNKIIFVDMNKKQEKYSRLKKGIFCFLLFIIPFTILGTAIFSFYVLMENKTLLFSLIESVDECCSNENQYDKFTAMFEFKNEKFVITDSLYEILHNKFIITSGELWETLFRANMGLVLTHIMLMWILLFGNKLKNYSKSIISYIPIYTLTSVISCYFHQEKASVEHEIFQGNYLNFEKWISFLNQCMIVDAMTILVNIAVITILIINIKKIIKYIPSLLLK